MQGLPSILSVFHKEFNQFNNTGALDYVRFYLSYGIKITLKAHFCVKMFKFCHYACKIVMDKIK